MPIVRLYPIGEGSPRPLPDAQPDVPAAGDTALFGGNQARDLQVAGQQLGQASDSLFALYERHAQAANDTRVQDLNNQFIDGRRGILGTYYSQTGADAIHGADGAATKLTALKDQLLGQTANPYQRRKLGPILDTHLAASADGIARHVAGQQAVYGRSVAATAIGTAQAEAKADPSVMANAVLRAEGAARVLHAGQPSEAVEAGARAAGGSVIAGVIGDRLARNDPQGVTLLRQYGEHLEPRVRRPLDAAAGMLSNNLAAAAWLRDRSAALRPLESVESSIGTLLDQDGIVGTRQRLDGIEARRGALAALNEREFADDPARLRANRAAIETDSAQSRAAVKAETDSLYTDLRRHLTTGGPDGGPAITPPPATIMSRLTDAQRDAVTAQVNDAIAGHRPSTDPQTWYAIRQGLTSDDADERQRWTAANLVPFMGRLSTEDFAALETLQTAMRSNDGGAGQNRLQLVNRMADQALQSAGIDPTPRLDAVPDDDAVQAARFHRALQAELSAFESNGRKATAMEAQDMVDRLKETAIKSGWLMASEAETFDDSSIDDALHKDGAELAQAESSARHALYGFSIAGNTEDFESFHRQMEEYRQREAAEQPAAGTGGSSGAPATEPDPGSPAYREADIEARQIVSEQPVEEQGGRGMAPPTEPSSGSPEYLTAEMEARKLDESAWDNLGFFGQLGVAFKRFDEESKKSGAALEIDSQARRQEKALELQQKAKETPDELTLVEKQYLVRNRNAAPNLAGAVARLIDARRRLDELPSSDALRRLSGASTVAEAGQLLRDHPGEIARAIGVEGLPALTVSLITAAALGPVGSAIALTGTSGLEGYATGLVGALAREGVDVSNADDLTRALQDNALMERVRKDATSEGAIAAGVNAGMMMFPVRWRPKRASISLAMKVPTLNAKGRGFETFPDFKNEIGHAPKGYAWHHIVEQTTTNIEKFGAKNIHNTNNLILLPDGPGTIHGDLSALYSSIQDFSRPLTVRKWLALKSLEEQAAYGREFIDQRRKARK